MPKSNLAVKEVAKGISVSPDIPDSVLDVQVIMFGCVVLLAVVCLVSLVSVCRWPGVRCCRLPRLLSLCSVRHFG